MPRRNFRSRISLPDNLGLALSLPRGPQFNVPDLFFC
jgi:hypothetical protein